MEISPARVLIISMSILKAVKKVKCAMGAAFAARRSKRVWLECSQACFENFMRNTNDFMGRYVTSDETWVYYHLHQR